MEPQPQPTAQHDLIFRSKLPDIPIPTHLPLHSYCFQNLPLFRHRPCLIDADTGHILSHADAHLATRRISAGLHSIGIRKGDVVMLLLRNCHQFALAFLGASHRGAAVTTANPFYTSSELAKQVSATKSKLIITQSAYVEKIKDFADCNGVMIMCIDSSEERDGVLSFSALMRADENDAPEVDITPDDVVAIPFSSGTSGLPKGVMLTHRNLVTTVAQLVDGENPHQYTHSEDVLLCVLPMFHIYALNSILLCGIRAGAAVLIVQKFEITTLLELVPKYRVTVASLVPPIILALVKCGDVHRYDLSSIRAVVTGAAPMGVELQDAVKARLPHATLGQGYGMTEAGPLAISLAFAKEPFKTKSGACGTVVRNAEMKIVDTETGVSLPRNKAGEICIRGTKVMKGRMAPMNLADLLRKRGVDKRTVVRGTAPGQASLGRELSPSVNPEPLVDDSATPARSGAVGVIPAVGLSDTSSSSEDEVSPSPKRARVGSSRGKDKASDFLGSLRFDGNARVSFLSDQFNPRYHYESILRPEEDKDLEDERLVKEWTGLGLRGCMQLSVAAVKGEQIIARKSAQIRDLRLEVKEVQQKAQQEVQGARREAEEARREAAEARREAQEAVARAERAEERLARVEPSRSRRGARVRRLKTRLSEVETSWYESVTSLSTNLLDQVQLFFPGANRDQFSITGRVVGSEVVEEEAHPPEEEVLSEPSSDSGEED